jgi:CRP/FNR family cyclic AMP-dependent transcriptional regulator
VEPRVEHSLVNAVRNVPVFASFDDQMLLKIVGASTNLVWGRGSIVFEPGSEAEALYIVLSGRVRIFDTTDGEEVEIVQLGPGEFFGELSLLFQTTHSKTAVTLEDSELMVIPKESFQELVADYPEIAAIFRKSAEERYPARAAELSRLS